MYNSASPRASSRYTELPRPSTPVSRTSRSSMYPSTNTKPSGDVLQGGSAFGLATPIWRQGVESEWRSAHNRINPNPALTAPSTPRSTSLSLTFPHTRPSLGTTKSNVDLPPRKGDLFRRAGESNDLPPPQPTSHSTHTPLSTPSSPRHTDWSRSKATPPSTPPAPAPLSPVRDTPHRQCVKPLEHPPRAREPAHLTPVETPLRTPLPERGRGSSSPRDVAALTPPPATPRPRREADNSYHEPTAEEKARHTDTPRASLTAPRATTPRTTRVATGLTSPPAPAPAPRAAPPPPTRLPITNERTTSLSHSASSDVRRYLIPPQREQDVGKLVVVLDLDETLVYSREGGIFQRPGVKNLLEVLRGRCELIVWTAGVRDYALEAIQLIDTCCAVQHCIYRHPMWFTNDVACPKDLRLLGRPLDTIVIVDNTPDVFRLNPDNAILVTDFLGKASCNRGQPDRTLTTLAAIFDHVLTHFPAPRATHIMASKRLIQRGIKTDDGVMLNLFTLKHDRVEDLQREPIVAPSLVARFAMLRYMNRGSHLSM